MTVADVFKNPTFADMARVSLLPMLKFPYLTTSRLYVSLVNS
jgi:hypothetical protein